MPAWVLLCLVGSASVERVAVLTFVVDTRGGGISASQVYEGVAEAADQRPRLRLLTSEELFVADPNLGGQRIEDCGTDAACLSDYLSRFSARPTMGLLVVVNHDADPPLVGLRLVDTDRREIAGSATATGEDPLQLIQRHAAELFDGAGHPRWGLVTIETDPPGAAVRFGDGVAPRSPESDVFFVAPGRYQVVASLDGYESAARSVDVRPGARDALTLGLSPLPPPAFYERWWFWTIVGGVVAVGAAATTAALLTRSREVCVGNAALLEDC